VYTFEGKEHSPQLFFLDYSIEFEAGDSVAVIVPNDIGRFAVVLTLVL
jgi:hypothetical protein